MQAGYDYIPTHDFETELCALNPLTSEKICGLAKKFRNTKGTYLIGNLYVTLKDENNTVTRNIKRGWGILFTRYVLMA
jgi:hypothetical protein